MSTRRGLRNQLKTLLWRKASPGPSAASGRESPRPSGSGGSGSGWATPPAGGPGAPTGGSVGGPTGPYSSTSVEGQMRALADLAFLMQARSCYLATYTKGGGVHCHLMANHKYMKSFKLSLV